MRHASYVLETSPTDSTSPGILPLFSYMVVDTKKRSRAAATERSSRSATNVQEYFRKDEEEEPTSATRKFSAGWVWISSRLCGQPRRPQTTLKLRASFVKHQRFGAHSDEQCTFDAERTHGAYAEEFRHTQQAEASILIFFTRVVIIDSLVTCKENRIEINFHSIKTDFRFFSAVLCLEHILDVTSQLNRPVLRNTFWLHWLNNK